MSKIRRYLCVGAVFVLCAFFLTAPAFAAEASTDIIHTAEVKPIEVVSYTAQGSGGSMEIEKTGNVRLVATFSGGFGDLTYTWSEKKEKDGEWTVFPETSNSLEIRQVANVRRIKVTATDQVDQTNAVEFSVTPREKKAKDALFSSHIVGYHDKTGRSLLLALGLAVTLLGITAMGAAIKTIRFVRKDNQDE